LTPLATGSLHSLEAPQGIDLLHPVFTYTNKNQAAACTCNTRPRVSPHHIVNHSSQPGATNHRSSDAPVLNLPLDECIDNTHKYPIQIKEKKKRMERKTQTSDQKPNKKPRKDHLREREISVA
jgi:hypothetical protein